MTHSPVSVSMFLPMLAPCLTSLSGTSSSFFSVLNPFLFMALGSHSIMIPYSFWTFTLYRFALPFKYLCDSVSLWKILLLALRSALFLCIFKMLSIVITLSDHYFSFILCWNEIWFELWSSHWNVLTRVINITPSKSIDQF